MASGERTEALEVVEGPLSGVVIPLRDELLIGRSAPGSGALGDDPELSRRHARIVRTATGTIALIDVGSSNGTRVNGERVATHDLAVGDRIEVGGSVLELISGPALHEEAPVPRAAGGEPDASAFRAEFPVFRRVRYLNAGTDGPVPARSAAAAQAEIHNEAEQGRSGAEHWGNMFGLWATLRSRYARLLGCDPDEAVLTRSTTDGVNTVVSGLPLGPGDEILTSDEEHPGMYAPLGGARERRGCSVRVVPFDELANEVRPETRLVACSHVSWVTGKIADVAALRATGVPFLLDGAQGLGAVPVDVKELGCDFYAASGQKWLCGPDRTGTLYVRAERIEDLSPSVWPNYMSLADPERPLDLILHAGARRFDLGILPGVQTLWAMASLDVLEEAGIGWITSRGPRLAAQLAEMLDERGVVVSDRGPTTLVTFEAHDAPAQVEVFEEAGVVLRDIPGHDLLRVSIGAWCLEEDLDAVVALAASMARVPSPRRATMAHGIEAQPEAGHDATARD